MAVGLACAAIALAGAAVAQTRPDNTRNTAVRADAAAAEREAQAGVGAQRMAFWEIVEAGGSLMYVLAAISLLTVGFVVYFAIVLRPAVAVPRALYREVIEKTRAGALDDARRACEYKPCPLAHVVLAALEHVRQVPHLDPQLLKAFVEDEGGRQAEAIQGQTQYLLDVAVISPMVGLLGTVFGMLNAFSAIALDIARAKPIVLAAGVAQALITTAFGLIIGIPAMAFYAYFRRRAAGMVMHLEAASTEVLTALLSKREP
jgi:biopolymer transport protein ExbB